MEYVTILKKKMTPHYFKIEDLEVKLLSMNMEHLLKILPSFKLTSKEGNIFGIFIEVDSIRKLYKKKWLFRKFENSLIQYNIEAFKVIVEPYCL